MTCRSVLPRELVLPRFKNEPINRKNIKKLHILLDLAESNPRLFAGDGESESYALLDFRDMWQIAIEDMDTVDKSAVL